MNEAWFPLFGAAFVMLAVLPACTLLAKMALVVLERDNIGGPMHCLNLRYLILTGASFLPLAWFLSAGLHQAESGQSALACLLPHNASSQCFEPMLFTAALSLLVLGCAIPLAERLRAPRASRSTEALRTLTRIISIIGAAPCLETIRHRLVVTERVGFAVGTVGLFKPRVVVSVRYAESVTDEMLASALAHEAEHVRSFDPLRYAVLRGALAINPIGKFLIAGHTARWLVAREAHCDREAVVRGASPLGLAEAIVFAARPMRRDMAVALGAVSSAVLRFRVSMLLAYTERSPQPCCRRSTHTFRMATGALLITLFLPHRTSTAALDALHSGAEQALIYCMSWVGA